MRRIVGVAVWVAAALVGPGRVVLEPAPASAQEPDSVRQLAERLATVERQLRTLEGEKVSPTSVSGYMDFHYNDFQPGGSPPDPPSPRPT